MPKPKKQKGQNDSEQGAKAVVGGFDPVYVKATSIPWKQYSATPKEIQAEN